MNSQVMVGRERWCLRFQPGPPPLRYRCPFWVLDINHFTQFLLSGRLKTFLENVAWIIQDVLIRAALITFVKKKKRWEDFRRWGEGSLLIIFTCNLANTPDLWLPKPYFCRALSSSSVLSVYTSCSTCQSNSSSSSSSSSPAPSPQSVEMLNRCD